MEPSRLSSTKSHSENSLRTRQIFSRHRQHTCLTFLRDDDDDTTRKEQRPHAHVHVRKHHVQTLTYHDTYFAENSSVLFQFNHELTFISHMFLIFQLWHKVPNTKFDFNSWCSYAQICMPFVDEPTCIGTGASIQWH